MPELAPWLNKLEALVDLDHVARTRDLQRRAFAFQPVPHVPTMISYPLAPDEWPTFGYREFLADPAKMLLSELQSVYEGAKLRDDRLYGIRANFGTGIIASLFGCPTHTFDHALPIAKEVSRDELLRLLDGGVPNLRTGDGGRALDTIAYFREALRPYPKLSQVVGSSLLDIQGPFDNASIVWGSSIFVALYEEPERVRRLLDLVTETILAMVREHRRVDGCPLTEQDGHWLELGGVCLRNDSSINLSRTHYLEFVKPCDRRVLAPWGGWIHFCGRAHQWWPELLDLPGLKGINPFQGEFYDLYTMYEACERAKVAIVQWVVPVDARCRERIRTGFSRIVWARDYADACRLRDRLHATGHAEG